MENANHAHFSYETIDINKILTILYKEQIDKLTLEVINAELSKCNGDQISIKYEVYEKNDRYFSFVEKGLKSNLSEAESEINVFLSYNPENICIVAFRNEKRCWSINILCDENVTSIFSYDGIMKRDIVKSFQCCFD